MNCDHDPHAVCWLCSDDRPFWRIARGGGDPPNIRFIPIELTLEETALNEAFAEFEEGLGSRMIPPRRHG